MPAPNTPHSADGPWGRANGGQSNKPPYLGASTNLTPQVIGPNALMPIYWPPLAAVRFRASSVSLTASPNCAERELRLRVLRDQVLLRFVDAEERVVDVVSGSSP